MNAIHHKNKARSTHQSRVELWDWFKGLAIIAVVLDHTKVVPEPLVAWSVNMFVIVTAATYSEPKYFFSGRKLALKILHLFLIILSGIFFFKTLNSIFGLITERSLIQILLNPYFFFIKNAYLGDIWYTGLHLQFLFLLFIGLRTGFLSKPKIVLPLALALTIFTNFYTHFVIHRFETIFFMSWLFFLCIGFYGIRPFLNYIEKSKHNRWLGVALGATLLICFYSLYPRFPWAFTNEARAMTFTAPFYVPLILLFTEFFYIIYSYKFCAFLKSAILLLGRYTLAIYLTHEPFERMWKVYFSEPILLAILSAVCGILFGMVFEWLFVPIQKQIEKLFDRYHPRKHHA